MVTKRGLLNLKTDSHKEFFILIAAGPISDRINKIRSELWVGEYERMKDARHLLGQWLLTGSPPGESKYDVKKNVEYEGYDGWYNNLARPDLGAIGKSILIFLTAQIKYFSNTCLATITRFLL